MGSRGPDICAFGSGRSRPRLRRSAAVGLAAVVALLVSGCYGPVRQTASTMRLTCDQTWTYPDGSEQHTTLTRDADVLSTLPEWTTPGGGTPFAVAIPLDPESTAFGAPLVPASASGLDADQVDFSLHLRPRSTDVATTHLPVGAHRHRGPWGRGGLPTHQRVPVGDGARPRRRRGSFQADLRARRRRRPGARPRPCPCHDRHRPADVDDDDPGCLGRLTGHAGPRNAAAGPAAVAHWGENRERTLLFDDRLTRPAPRRQRSALAIIPPMTANRMIAMAT